MAPRMERAQGVVARTLGRFGDWLAGQRHLMAVRDGVVAVLPLVLIGSLALLIHTPPLVGSWAEWYERAMAVWKPRILMVNLLTVGVIAVPASFTVAYALAKRYEQDALSAGMMSVIAFLLATRPPTRAVLTVDGTEEWALAVSALGAGGLFLAILVGLLTGEVQRFCMTRRWHLRLPESVPEVIYRSFSAVVPALALFGIVWGLSYALQLDLLRLVDFVVSPIRQAGNSLAGVLSVIFVDSAIWLFGVHAIALLGVLKPVWLQFLAENQEAVRLGVAIPNIAPREFYIWFVWMGGSGTTLVLAVHLWWCRSAALRGVGKVGLVPALFNINEPILFGAPVVMNPLLAVPFIVAPLVCGAIAWTAFHLGWVVKPHLDILWTLPAPVGGFLTTGGDPRALVLQVVNLAIAAIIYYPFVRAYDRRLLVQEAAKAVSDTGEPRASEVNSSLDTPGNPGSQQGGGAPQGRSR